MAFICECDVLDDEESGGVSLLDYETAEEPNTDNCSDRVETANRIALREFEEEPFSHISGPLHGGVDLDLSPPLIDASPVSGLDQEANQEANHFYYDNRVQPALSTASNFTSYEPQPQSYPTQVAALHATIPEPVFRTSGWYAPSAYSQPAGSIAAQHADDLSSQFNASLPQNHVLADAVPVDMSLPTTGSAFPPHNNQNAVRHNMIDANHSQHADARGISPSDDVPDVVSFLEKWDMMQADMPQAGTIRFDSDSIRNWRPPRDDSIGYTTDSSRDIQGLDWQSLNTDRDSVRMARKAFYPAKDESSSANMHKPRMLQRQSYDFKRMYSNHTARFTHYQLRHVLAARGRNDIFYAAYNKVMRTSLACPSIADTVINLSSSSAGPNRATVDCHITTIAVTPAPEFAGYLSDSVLVTGGFEGEYSLLNLNSDRAQLPTEGFVTHALDGITTHIHTLRARRTGALAAAFCSNDRKLRVLDIGTDRWLHTFSYADQLNCAATAPDGRLRVVVGDTRDTLVTDAERGHVLFSMRNHTDDAFACAWADDGWHVATGAQDGRVVVYDARKWASPLAELDCEMGCARSLQFVGAGAKGGPALVVAEADDIVSVYDTRQWASKQTLDFFGSVAGVAAFDGGREIVVANGDKTVGGLMLFERRDDDFIRFEQPVVRNPRRKRGSDVDDDMESYWENQPKRLGLGTEALLI